MIKWNDDDLQRFFGASPDRFDLDREKPVTAEDEILHLPYCGGTINYEFVFHRFDNIIFVAASFEEPFGPDSLFEIAVPCDLISVVDDPYNSGQIGLYFYRGNPDDHRHLMMQLYKRPDGHLKLWPVHWGLLAADDKGRRASPTFRFP